MQDSYQKFQQCLVYAYYDFEESFVRSVFSRRILVENVPDSYSG